MLFFFSVLFSCQQKSWKTADDCSKLAMGDIKDDCWSNFIVEVFASDAKKGEQIITEEISNASVQDFLWLDITRKIDPNTLQYCHKIEDQILQKRCETLVSRPHLHRETLRSQRKRAGSQQSNIPVRKPQ